MTLKRFLKENKKARGNAKYVASQSFTDENGKALEWEVRPISTTENEAIKEDCVIEVPIPGKIGMYRPKMLVGKYQAKLMAASVVEPNLKSTELQDSYSVTKPEDLIKAMIDNPVEYNDFFAFIQSFNGFTDSVEDEVEEAKN